MNKPVIKICGNTNIDDAAFALECGADLLGFIFYEKSPRYITPENAGRIINILKEKFTFESAGVFVNHTKEYIERTINVSGIDILQFHGDEVISDIRQFNKKKIKVLRIKDNSDIAKCSEFSSADYFLFDTFSKKAYGGTGRAFDWEILADFEYRNKLFLSGGISSANVSDAVNKVKPYGLDLCSSIEKSPGVKDNKKILEFFKAFQASIK